MSDFSEKKYFLGLQVCKLHSGLFLSQSKYALDILKKNKILDWKPTSTPFSSIVKFNSESPFKKVDATLFMWLVGNLVYLTRTKLEIFFVVNLVFIFMRDPPKNSFVDY